MIKINAPTTCLMRILDRRSIIGLYFFENDADQAATINGAQYRDMMT